MSQRTKHDLWLGRKRRVRKKVRGRESRPRLTVYRSGKHIYAQIIDDGQGVTLAAASSQDKDFSEKNGNTKGGAGAVGKLLGDRAKAKGIEQVVFDRNGYLYHGRVKALADAVRETGVSF